MKNIIIITYHMIPNTKYWGASQRMFYLANDLVKQGNEVSVVHGNFGEFGHYGKIKKFKSFPINIKPSFIQNFQESLQPKINSGPQTPSSVGGLKLANITKLYFLKVIKNFIRKVEKLFFNDFNYIGLIVRMWTISAWPVINRLILSTNTNMIIISGPLFTTFSLIRKIKCNHPNLKIVLDYRDPWNLLKSGSSLTRMKEYQYLRMADLVVLFSDRFKNEMLKNFNIDKEKYVTVLNGYDKNVWDEIKLDHISNSSQSSKKIKISYIGSHITFAKNSGRDPSNLIEAVIRSKNSSNLELSLVGCVDYPNQNYISDAEITFTPQVSHRNALEIMYQSDIIVVLSTDIRPSLFTLTGKIFDCISSGKIVLGIANNMEIDYIKLIDKLNIGIGCKNTVRDIQNSIDYCYSKARDIKVIDDLTIDINKYSREHQNYIYIKSIERLF